MGKYATETYEKYDAELKEKFGTTGFSLDDFQREYSKAMDSAWSKDMAEQHDENAIQDVSQTDVDHQDSNSIIAVDQNDNEVQNIAAEIVVVDKPSPITDMGCPIMVPSQIPAPPIAPPVAPLHRIDEAKKQPPAVSNIDNVIIDIATEPVPIAPAPNKPVLPEVIKPLAPADPVADTTAVVSKIDNSTVINKFQYLQHIEDIANKNGYQVAMCELAGVDGRPLGLISVTSYGSSNPEPDISRCFTIDDGNIIDHRAKLFSFAPMAVANGLVIEDCPCWALTIQGQKGSVINDKLLTTIFNGGMESINDRFLFNPDYAALNKKVALITLPTIGLKKPGRNALQTRLVNMDKAKVFDTAIASAPGSRFRFVEDRLDENDLSKFTLSNVGVSAYYGGPVLNTKQVLIVSTNGKVDIKD